MKIDQTIISAAKRPYSMQLLIFIISCLMLITSFFAANWTIDRFLFSSVGFLLLMGWLSNNRLIFTSPRGGEIDISNQKTFLGLTILHRKVESVLAGRIEFSRDSDGDTVSQLIFETAYGDIESAIFFSGLTQEEVVALIADMRATRLPNTLVFENNAGWHHLVIAIFCFFPAIIGSGRTLIGVLT